MVTVPIFKVRFSRLHLVQRFNGILIRFLPAQIFASVFSARENNKLDIQVCDGVRGRCTLNFIIFFGGGGIFTRRVFAIFWLGVGICLVSSDGARVCRQRYQRIIRGRRSEAGVRGTVFADTPAGKLDVWLRMAEPAQVNLAENELGSNIDLLSGTLHLCVLCDLALLLSPSLSPSYALL